MARDREWVICRKRPPKKLLEGIRRSNQHDLTSVDRDLATCRPVAMDSIDAMVSTIDLEIPGLLGHGADVTREARTRAKLSCRYC